ncbi:hypothetical protein CPB83DRAFT_859418 [Crepidotus variabilis]|uniref:Uncharacterized protein n=1 Tax=Crepidotus variabilis TaxID=179855 RepID=A0A9P6JM56_9AGAR|nr:hypothetical protein CPB83DRAFT_859418 [Crepidotus variabilis]
MHLTTSTPLVSSIMASLLEGTPPSANGPSDESKITTFLKFTTMGVIISAIAYGVVFTLAVMSFHLLHKTSLDGKKRIHYLLFAYIVFMFILSTVNIVAAIHMNLNAIVSQTLPKTLEVGKNVGAVVIVLVTWGSDGFLLWRAAVLYEGVSTARRKIVNCFIGFLMVAQLVTGTMYFLSNFMDALNPPRYSDSIFVAFACTTLSINWIITGLVVGRLLHFRGKVSRSLGADYGTPFGRIITMCVESAALIIIFSTIFLVLNLMKKNPFSFSRILLTNIYVIGPFLILYRVAQGKAFLTSSNSFYSVPGNSGGQRSATLQFNDRGRHTLSTGNSTKIEVNISDEVHKDYYDHDRVELGNLSNSQIPTPIKRDMDTPI